MINILEKKVDRISIINNIYVYSYLLCAVAAQYRCCYFYCDCLLIFFSFVSSYTIWFIEGRAIKTMHTHKYMHNFITLQKRHMFASREHTHTQFLGMERWIASCRRNRIHRINTNTEILTFLEAWAMSHTLIWFTWKCVCFSFWHLPGFIFDFIIYVHLVCAVCTAYSCSSRLSLVWTGKFHSYYYLYYLLLFASCKIIKYNKKCNNLENKTKKRRRKNKIHESSSSSKAATEMAKQSPNSKTIQHLLKKKWENIMNFCYCWLKCCCYFWIYASFKRNIKWIANALQWTTAIPCSQFSKKFNSKKKSNKNVVELYKYKISFNFHRLHFYSIFAHYFIHILGKPHFIQIYKNKSSLLYKLTNCLVIRKKYWFEV